MNNALTHLMREFLIQEAMGEITVPKEEIIKKFLDDIKNNIADTSFYGIAESVADIMATHVLEGLMAQAGIKHATDIPKFKSAISVLSDMMTQNCFDITETTGDPKIDFIMKSALRRAFAFLVDSAVSEIPEKLVSAYRYDFQYCPLEILDQKGEILNIEDEYDEGNIWHGAFMMRIKPGSNLDTIAFKELIKKQILIDVGWWLSFLGADMDKIENKLPINNQHPECWIFHSDEFYNSGVWPRNVDPVNLT